MLGERRCDGRARNARPDDYNLALYHCCELGKKRELLEASVLGLACHDVEILQCLSS